jgi:general secretion pathway protein F
VSGTLPFVFRAVRRDGSLETGIIEAATQEAAVAMLGGRGVFAIEVTKHASGRPTTRVNADDLALGLRALATLLGSGIPIARALAILPDLVPPAWRPALPDLRRRVEHGEHLATALEGSSLPLPSHVIGVIQAGEAGSGLARAVDAAAGLLEARATTRAAIRNALAYPMLLAVAGSASVALLVGLVLPRFAELLQDTGQSLPFSTGLALTLGSSLQAGFIPGIVALACAVMLWRAWVGSPGGLARWHELLLSLPLVGPLRRSTAAANACSALSALLEAGVPLSTALPHAARAPGDGAVESRLLAALGRIQRGERISSAVETEDALTPTVLRLVRIGEETGQLAGMLAHAARIESNHAVHRLQRLIRALEPTLILLFGGVVMAVAAALLQAMYGLRPAF